MAPVCALSFIPKTLLKHKTHYTSKPDNKFLLHSCVVSVIPGYDKGLLPSTAAIYLPHPFALFTEQPMNICIHINMAHCQVQPFSFPLPPPLPM